MNHARRLFEFHPPMADDRNPEESWTKLKVLGYERCVACDNFGDLLEFWSTLEVPSVAAILKRPFEERGCQNWDAAAIRRNDPHRVAIKRTFCT